jgi:hypothetical protein
VSLLPSNNRYKMHARLRRFDTWDNEAAFSKTLASHFNGDAVKTVKTRSMNNQLPRSVWREWSFGGPANDLLIAAPCGKLCTTNSLDAEIGIIDPKTRETEFVSIGKDSVYPYTFRFDDKGELGFTLALSNKIGHMNVKTKEITLIGLPSNGLWRWISDAFLPSILEVASWFGKKDLHVTLSHHKVTGEGREVLNLPYSTLGYD